MTSPALPMRAAAGASARERAATSTGPHEPAAPRAVDGAHLVRFYDDDGQLCAHVAEFFAAALAGGHPLVVIATAAHRAALSAALAEDGVDLAAAVATGDAVVLDAQETLASMCVDGAVDATRARAALRALLVRPDGRAVYAFGEMVDVLWHAGRKPEAHALEEIWNQARREIHFTLLCAYSRIESAADRRALCREHDFVDVTGTAHEDDALLAEVNERRDIERALRDAVRDVREIDGARAEALERTERLLRITSALADAVGVADVHRAVVDATADVLDASSAALWLVDGGGAHAILVRSVGYGDGQLDRFQAADLSQGGFPAVDCIRRRRAIFMDTQSELLERYPALAAHVTDRRNYSIACIPIVSANEVLGSLAFTFDDVPRMSPETRSFVALIGRYAGQALERLRLLDVEQQVRKAAEARARRESLLSRASLLLSSAAPELGATLQAVVEAVLDDFAEGAAVLLLEPDGERVSLAAAAHRSPDALPIARALLTERPLRKGDGIYGRVIATGETMLVTDIPAPDPASLPPGTDPSILRHAARSAVCAPLRAGGRVFGSLLAARRDLPAFVDEDKRLIEALADRAAIAIERSRLHDENEAARRRAELLYRLADTMNRAQKLDDVFAATLDAAQDIGADRSAVLVFDDADVMRFRAAQGLSREYRLAVEGHSPWKKGDQGVAPVVVGDALADPAWAAYRAVFEKEGIRALAFIPLLAGHELEGKLMLYWNAPRAVGEQELGVASAIASHAGAAVARMKLMEELSEGIRFNEMFTGMLGHDLRNPLGAILTAAQLIVRRGDDRTAKPVARILTSGARMSRMIDQLLDFTRVRVGGGIPLAARDVDLVPVLRAILDEHEEAKGDRALELTSTGDTHGLWDADRLMQVFSNLVANAVQHGTGAVRVHVDGGDKDGVVVAVQNGGVISDTVVGKLFEPMAGGHSRRDGSRGLGLGLYISQQIIEAHGGTIEVTSSSQSGETSFTIWLPRAARL